MEWHVAGDAVGGEQEDARPVLRLHVRRARAAELSEVHVADDVDLRAVLGVDAPAVAGGRQAEALQADRGAVGDGEAVADGVEQAIGRRRRVAGDDHLAAAGERAGDGYAGGVGAVGVLDRDGEPG